MSNKINDRSNCQFFYTNKFRREYKKFKKKCKSLEDDFNRFEEVLNIYNFIF